MIDTTKSYMRLENLNADPSTAEVQEFMRTHEDWVDEAIALFESLKPAQVTEEVAQNLRPEGLSETEWSGKLKAVGWTVGAIAAALIIKALGSYFGLF